MMHRQNLFHEWCTQVLELGIGLGHIKRYINKMLFVGGAPFIGIECWIGSYQTTCQQMFFVDVVPMYWN